ncbi:MAG: hypothetical protein Kow00108_18670 [Calditrichia bacterium]
MCLETFVLVDRIDRIMLLAGLCHVNPVYPVQKRDVSTPLDMTSSVPFFGTIIAAVIPTEMEETKTDVPGRRLYYQTGLTG